MEESSLKPSTNSKNIANGDSVPESTGKKKLFGVHIGFGKKKKSDKQSLKFTQSSSSTSDHPSALGVPKQFKVTETENPAGNYKIDDMQAYADFNNTIDVTDDEMSGIVDEEFLENARKEKALFYAQDKEDPDASGLNDEEYLKEELYVSKYTKEWMRTEDSKEKRGVSQAQKKVFSVADSFPVMTLNLPLPISRPLSERGKESAKPGWLPPDSWVVSVDENASKTSLSNRQTVNEPMSCIRVFKREGNFATVSCALSISAKDLCTLLAKKFFVNNEVTGKFQLWLVKRGIETLMQPSDRPLRIQRQLLYEIGYDQDVDNYPEILREDNSYLFRWIYSDSSIFTQNYSSIFLQNQANPNSSRIMLPSLYDQKILDIVKMSTEEILVPSKVDLSGLNIESLPVIMFKHAKTITSLQLNQNTMLEIPQDFAQLCMSLSTLSFTKIQLQKIPKAISLITSLEFLDLSHNLITTLRETNLQNLIRLRVAKFGNNRFLAKNSVALEVVSAWKNLKTLDLSCNWIRGDCPSSILFVGSGITEIPDDNSDFHFECSLLELDLSYNLIRYLPKNFGKHMKHLKKFYIVSNNLAKLPVELINGEMDEIEILDIRGNSLRGVAGVCEPTSEAITSTEFRNAITNGSFVSSPTTISSPSNSDFSNQSLKKLFLDNNQISTLRITYRLPSLTTIVSHRNTNLLQLGFSSNLPALTTLIVSSSKLAFLPDDIFNFTPKLKVLVLNHNQISTLPLSLSALKNLVCLELAHNTVTKLPSSIKELKFLEILDLRGNNLNDLPPEIWDLKVKFLNLSSNVFETWPENPYLMMGNNTNEIGPRGSLISVVTSMNRNSTYNTIPSVQEKNKEERSYSTEHASIHDDKPGNDSDRSAQYTNSNPSLIAPLSLSLQWLSVADNRLETSFFENVIFHLLSLKSLNVSHNDLFTVPNGVFRNCSGVIEELYLSGNHLTQLPEEIHTFKNLKRLYLNINRLGSLPPELGKIPNLRILDVGRNQLRYNVGNWPYDWNWNWNTELRYLNLSGNPRLDIRPSITAAPPISKKEKTKEKDKDLNNENIEKGDISRFDSMSKMRILGLMEVGLSVPVPDEQRSRRVRVHALGGASAHWKKQIGMDITSLAESPSRLSDVNVTPTSITSSTMVIGSTFSTPISTQLDMALNILPTVSYGVSDNMGPNEKISTWDLVVLGGKFFQQAKEEARPVDEGGDTTNLRTLRKSRIGECVFGLFDGGKKGGNWCGKYLYDTFTSRFSAELRKIVKERQSKGMNEKGEFETEREFSDSIAQASDSTLIQHSLRKTFLLINKQLGDISWKTEFKPKEFKDSSLMEESKESKTRMRSDTSEKRKYSVNFETPLQGKIKKTKKPSSSLVEDSTKSFRRKFSLAEGDSKLKEHKPTEEVNTSKLPSKPRTNEGDLYWDDSDSEEEDEGDLTEDAYINLAENGYSGLIAYLVNTQLYIANCGDIMAVVSRNGVAVPLSMKHTLFSFQASSSTKPRVDEQLSPGQLQSTESTDNGSKTARRNSDDKVARKDVSREQDKEKIAAKQELQNANFAKKELHRIRETGAYVSHDGFICEKTVMSRAFGFYNSLPHLNASPHISVSDLSDNDEFLIIATGSFWNTISYQTAVDVARLKSDDAIEAAMVLRDFATAYGNKGMYIVDEESVFPEEKYRIQNRFTKSSTPIRYHSQNPLTVMVINLRDYIGGKQKKVFTKIKRRRDETVDSAIARLAPEIEPPTGLVFIVFTDVRNSTQLWEKRPLSMRVAIRQHNTIMRRNLRSCNGYEVKTEGDAFMVSFKNVVDALKWAMTVQMQLLEADWPQDILETPEGQDVFGPNSLNEKSEETLLYRGLSIRMGMHCGNPVSELDPITRRMDYFGPMVNKSSRICGAADGGQLLVSQDIEKMWRRMKFQSSREEPVHPEKMTMSMKRSISGNEKIRSLLALDPVFINVGEKKLKGFDNLEPLISVLPRQLVGRHKIPPPAIPGTEETEPKHLTAEPSLDFIRKDSHASSILNSSNFPTNIQTQVDLSISPNEDAEKDRRLSENYSGVKSVVSDGNLNLHLHETSAKLPILSSVFEVQDQKVNVFSAPILPQPLFSSDNETRNNVITEEKNFKEENFLFDLCERIEKVVLVFLIRRLQALEMLTSSSQADEIQDIFDSYGNRASSSPLENPPQLKFRRGASKQNFENAIERIERAYSSIKLILESSILADDPKISQQDQGDLVQMLQLLLSFATA